MARNGDRPLMHKRLPPYPVTRQRTDDGRYVEGKKQKYGCRLEILVTATLVERPKAWGGLNKTVHDAGSGSVRCAHGYRPHCVRLVTGRIEGTMPRRSAQPSICATPRRVNNPTTHSDQTTHTPKRVNPDKTTYIPIQEGGGAAHSQSGGRARVVGGWSARSVGGVLVVLGSLDPWTPSPRGMRLGISWGECNDA